MVSLSPTELGARADQIRQSVDLAVRDLLNTETDPFALATYLWTSRCNDLSLVNGSRLAAWGVGWAHKVFVDRDIGNRADETIASAALAAAALEGTKRSAFIDNADVMEGFQDLLSSELSTRAIPFNNPVYAAALLLAAEVVAVDEPRINEAAMVVADSFVVTASHGRTFGIGLVVRLLQEVDVLDRLGSLEGALRQALSDPQTGYEDQLYLVQALLLIHRSDELPAPILELAEHVIANSPIWSHIMVGVEDVEAAGDGRTTMPVSHLYRAALLDVTLRLVNIAANREEAQRNERYRGRVANGIFASLGVALVIMIPWMFLGRVMLPSTDKARRYWLRNEYNAMSPEAALLFFLGFLASMFLAMFTVVVIWTLWSLLIRSAIESDRRLLEVLGRRVRGVVKVWIAAATLLVGIANGPFLNALGDL